MASSTIRLNAPAAGSPEAAPRLWRAAGKSNALRRCLLAAAVSFPAMPLVPPAASANERPVYSYVELRADISKTGNEWPGAGSDAARRLAGFAASWNVRESWYLKAGYSREKSRYSNEVAGTVLKLRTNHEVVIAGGGRFWAVANGTDLYAEGLVLHSRVDHEFPDVKPAAGGQPTVGKRASVIADTGFGAAVGVRHALDGATEIEARLEARAVHDFTDTAIAFAGRRSLTDSLFLGLYVSYGETTKRNVGATARIGATLRYGF